MEISAAENEKLLKLYEGLRLCDVRDGLDCLGYHHVGSMNPSLRPLFRTRAYGIARTVRYLPYVGPAPRVEADIYMQWAGKYYGEICPYPWVDEIQPGDFCVIDQSGVDVGLMGSENTLRCIRAGARGIVSNGGVRDTDEIILQQIPFWSALVSHGMVQCRLQYDTRNVPVCVGGVTVRPGDVIFADGDGVLSVPREVAEEVARHALEEQQKDKRTRRALYEDLGRELDDTVR